MRVPASLAAVSMFGLLPAAPAGDGASSLSFEQDVRPILKAYCFPCHGEGTELRGGVDLRLRRFLLKVTDHGPVLVPGKPEGSLIVRLLRAGKMPRAEKKVPPGDIVLIERWIAAGAPTARPEPPEVPGGFFLTEEDRAFWAFQPILRPPAPPLAGDERARTAVDGFVLAKLREAGLDLAPEADPRTLIRRAYLDLL